MVPAEPETFSFSTKEEANNHIDFVSTKDN